MAELNGVAFEHFQESLKINVAGRCDLTLPSLKLHPMLPEGKDFADEDYELRLRY